MLKAAQFALASEKNANRARKLSQAILSEHPDSEACDGAKGLLAITEGQKKPTEGKGHTVAGTGFGDRPKIIRKHCKEGARLRLRREQDNQHDPNAVAVEMEVPGFLGKKWEPIGYIKKSRNKALAKKLDEGRKITAHVRSYWAPPDIEFPRVSILIFEDD
jgi:hypothetical protein